MAYACHKSIHAVIKNKGILTVKSETRNAPLLKHFFDSFGPQEIIYIQVKHIFFLLMT